MRPLYKTTLVVWSEFDAADVELSDLAREADSGDAYCSRSTTVRVQHPDADAEWDGTEFFNDPTEVNA